MDLPRILQVMKKRSSTILEAVKKAGYEPGKDFMIAMDAASSEWKGREEGRVYTSKGRNELYIRAELIEHWKKLC